MHYFLAPTWAKFIPQQLKKGLRMKLTTFTVLDCSVACFNKSIFMTNNKVASFLAELKKRSTVFSFGKKGVKRQKANFASAAVFQRTAEPSRLTESPMRKRRRLFFKSYCTENK